ncbi:MAG: transposase [Chlorobi bacterium]|nr:transposase [Chlorobiota bacterium]
MKIVSALTPADQQELENLMKSSPTHRVRQRAHAIVLRARGYSIDTLADIFSVHRNTISERIDAWTNDRFDGLSDAPKPGRPRALSVAEQDDVLEAVANNPQRISEALAVLKKDGHADKPRHPPGIVAQLRLEVASRASDTGAETQREGIRTGARGVVGPASSRAAGHA